MLSEGLAEQRSLAQTISAACYQMTWRCGGSNEATAGPSSCAHFPRCTRDRAVPQAVHASHPPGP
ncbi:hypothetical protein T4D_50 [Trichinella pseudospiralis]|uniref:Uncharacterized protein n=1 Tax=Trichinella pseudospiralis TaxID=6337 RepID=A0A0V1FQM5_TRIPS|nr:hypothetical protein T4D_50 [Trichinella pseudospiralis]